MNSDSSISFEWKHKDAFSGHDPSGIERSRTTASRSTFPGAHPRSCLPTKLVRTVLHHRDRRLAEGAVHEVIPQAIQFFNGTPPVEPEQQ